MSPKSLTRLFFIAVLSLLAVVGGTALVKAMNSSELSRYPVSPQEEALLASTKSAGIQGEHCVPADADNAELLATAENDVQVYQVWQMTIDEMPVLQVTTLYGEICGKINDSRTFADPQSHSLFDGMDQAVAVELATQYYQSKVAQAGGAAAYRDGLEAFMAEEVAETGTRTVFTTVEIEALSAVGVELSGNSHDVREHQGYEPL